VDASAKFYRDECKYERARADTLMKLGRLVGEWSVGYVNDDELKTPTTNASAS
jgi:hypothetical protein